VCGNEVFMHGRKLELGQLEAAYKKNKGSLVAIYGRRRIGKSYLVKHFGLEKEFWSFEGLESQGTQMQIKHFTRQMQIYTKDDFLSQTKFTNWTQVFKYMTDKINGSKKKIVIFFDEFQWMAANQSGLVSILKYYWDNRWLKSNVMIILCGSIASFMVEKVIKSKALYGRIDLELNIAELPPSDVVNFFSKNKSLHEVLLYNLVLGGVPKYYEILNLKESFDKNIQHLAFSKSGYLFNDYEKIFYSQFKEHQTYEKIIKFLSGGPKDLELISKHLKMPSGGGVKRYLKNLELARFIKVYSPIQKTKTNVFKYKVIDEYLVFYFKYILPNRKQILDSTYQNTFSAKIKPSWASWLGIAFENFCLKYSSSIVAALKIQDVVEDIGPYFERKENDGFQIDLLIKRTDKTWTICECKYHDKPVSVSVIKDMQEKIKRMKIPRGISVDPVLITVNGAEPSVEKLEYFSSILKIEDLYQKIN